MKSLFVTEDYWKLSDKTHQHNLNNDYDIFNFCVYSTEYFMKIKNKLLKNVIGDCKTYKNVNNLCYKLQPPITIKVNKFGEDKIYIQGQDNLLLFYYAKIQSIRGETNEHRNKI